MKRGLISLLFAGSLVSANGMAEDEPVALPIMRLNMDLAVTAAQATIEACREQGVSIAVSIVDRGGHVGKQVFFSCVKTHVPNSSAASATLLLTSGLSCANNIFFKT